MDFFGLLRIMLRRWFVVIPVLVLAAVLGLIFIGEPEITYSTGGSELLVSQETESDEQVVPTDPVVNTVDAGLLLRKALAQQSYRTSLDSRGLVGNFVIPEDTTPTIMTVNIASGDPEQVLDTGEAIVDDLEGLLEEAIGGDAAGVALRPVTDLGADDVVTSAAASSLSVSVAILPIAGASANPYPPDLSTVRLVTDIAQRPSVSDAVRAVAPSTGFFVTAQERDAAPIVNIGISTTVQAEIEPAYRAVVDAVNDELADLQFEAGVQDGANLTVLETLNPPGAGSRESSSIVRPAAGVALLGVAVACVLAVLVDGLIIRRRAKKQARTDDRDDDDAFDDDDDTYETIDERELQDALDE